MSVKLTAVFVTNAKPKENRHEIADTEQPGLRLVVQPTGVKSWVYRYERDDGKSVKVTLGRATGSGALSLQQARNAANDARRLRSLGKDPAAHRKAEHAAELAKIEADQKEARRKDDVVERVLDRFYADHVDNLKSAREVKRLLDKEVRPTWKGRRVDDIARADAIKLIDNIKARGAATLANRTRANARKFFNWCIEKGLVDSNPFERTAPAKSEVARERVLDDEEVRLLSFAIDRLEWPWRQFFAIALLTAQRREEIAGMRRKELENLTSKEPVWTLPSGRTKNRKEHAVPLARSAADIIASVPKIDDSPLVFTTTGETAISGFSRAKAKLDSTMLDIAREEAEARGDDPEKVTLAPWRLHDLRRTAASGMARLGVPVSVVEKVLNHVSGTFAGIVSVYQRHDFLAEKRHALTAWADHVASLTRPKETNVVRMRKEA